MAQYDDDMYAALFDDDNLPLSNNIKASAAQFTPLCDNASFLAEVNIPDSSIQDNCNTISQPQTVPSPFHTINNSPPDAQRNIGSALAPPIGVGQGTAMSPHCFVMER